MKADPALSCLIADLGKLIGLDDTLQADPQGVYALRIDGHLLVGMRPGDSEDELWLFADLGAP
jgi:hypothetical protein